MKEKKMDPGSSEYYPVEISRAECGEGEGIAISSRRGGSC